MLKKIIIILIGLSFLMTGAAMAAGDVTQGTVQKEIANIRTLTFTCVGDAADGSIPDKDTNAANTRDLLGWELWKVQAVPGVTAPDPLSDVYVKDANGIDLLGGNGVDELDDATPSEFPPLLKNVPSLQAVTGTLTLDVDNQTVNSATYVIIWVFRRGQK